MGSSDGSQHSAELQDCAKHMHSKLAELVQQHNLDDVSPVRSPGQQAGPQVAADAGRDSGSPSDASASKRAQAKARQVKQHLF